MFYSKIEDKSVEEIYNEILLTILNKPKPEAKYTLNSIAHYTTIDLLLHLTELEIFSFS